MVAGEIARLIYFVLCVGLLTGALWALVMFAEGYMLSLMPRRLRRQFGWGVAGVSLSFAVTACSLFFYSTVARVMPGAIRENIIMICWMTGSIAATFAQKACLQARRNIEEAHARNVEAVAEAREGKAC